MKLLQSQKDQIYSSIEEAGLSPAMFKLDESSGDTYLFLKDSNFYFIFQEMDSGKHYATYSPGQETMKENHYPGSWDGQLSYVRIWLGNIDRELKAPDRWGLLEEELKGINFDDIKYNNSKFTYQEYDVLKNKIEELKEKISKLDLVEEQLKEINEKLDHLLNLAKNMNKIDWKNLFVGTIFSLIMQLSIDKTTGQAIFAHVKNLFATFLPLPK